MPTIFALASGRSGTHFLSQLIRRNVDSRKAGGCVVRHEPYVFNPSMFGRPIYDFAMGERQYTRTLLERKARIVQRCGAKTYVETSHAFLKSYFDLAPAYFDNLKVIHLVRNPQQVARSEANREELTHWLHLPLRHYRGGDRRLYFRWSLTGLEPIFQHFDLAELSLFQRYAIQWIEIENRAMQFLDRFSMHDRCFTLQTPHDLNDKQRVAELIEFLELPRRGEISLAGRRNLNPKPTVISDGDQRQFVEVIAALPRDRLEIFAHPPYDRWSWTSALTSAASPLAQPSVQ
ncbi:MAG TPA: hypothetical protein VFV87_15985 [Pirellulaceae bacterium]|nr:hypothetical protein [Pirellulaceae bacterium]